MRVPISSNVSVGNRGVATGNALGTPRCAKYPLRHPQVSSYFNISPLVPALPDIALAFSYTSISFAGPCVQIFVATPLVGVYVCGGWGGEVLTRRAFVQCRCVALCWLSQASR